MLPVCSNFQIVACGLAINSGFQRTLQRVRGERRLRTLQGLGRALLQAKTAEQVGPLAMQSLAGNPCADREGIHMYSQGHGKRLDCLIEAS